MSSLRDWQRRALSAFAITRGEGKNTFLCVAAPGAGKTRFAIEAVRETNMRVMHVVPTGTLVTQARIAYANYGLRLFDATNSQGSEPTDHDGIVCTYAKLASNAHLFRALNHKTPTLIILDELHHVAHEAAWGDAVKLACGVANACIIVLTGTPFRSDGMSIPFLNYNGDGFVVPDFDYGFGAAWNDDPSPIRQVVFRTISADGHWGYESPDEMVRISRNISDTSTRHKDFSATLRNATLGIGGEMMLTAAMNDLRGRQATRPHAKGIILARDIKHANELTKDMKRYGHKAVAVHGSVTGETSDKATQIIRNFAKSSNDWIIGVNMLGEGVDIPNLEVEVRLDNKTTEMFFMQCTGRVIRRVTPQDPPAIVYMFDIPEFVEMAKSLDAVRQIALRDNPIIVCGPEGPVGPRPPSNVIDFGSENATHGQLVFQGVEHDVEKLDALQSALPDYLKPYAMEFVVAQHKAFTMPKVVEPIIAPIDPDEHANARLDLNELIQTLAARSDKPYPEAVRNMNATVNSLFGRNKPRPQWPLKALYEAQEWCDVQLDR